MSGGKAAIHMDRTLSRRQLWSDTYLVPFCQLLLVFDGVNGFLTLVVHLLQQKCLAGLCLQCEAEITLYPPAP